VTEVGFFALAKILKSFHEISRNKKRRNFGDNLVENFQRGGNEFCFFHIFVCF
jgi:hypothetical protein